MLTSSVFLAFPEASLVPRVLSYPSLRRNGETWERGFPEASSVARFFVFVLFVVFLVKKVRPFLSTFCTPWVRKYYQITNQKAKVLSYEYFYYLPLS